MECPAACIGVLALLGCAASHDTRATAAATTPVAHPPEAPFTRHLAAVTTLGEPGVAVSATAVAGSGTVAAESHQLDRLQTAAAGDARGAGIGPSDLDALLRDRDARLRTCYRRALARDRHLAGVIELRGTLGRDGTMVDVHASGLSAAPQVASCMAERLRRMRFLPPASGTLPFVHAVTLAP